MSGIGNLEGARTTAGHFAAEEGEKAIAMGQRRGQGAKAVPMS